MSKMNQTPDDIHETALRLSTALHEPDAVAEDHLADNKLDALLRTVRPDASPSIQAVTDYLLDVDEPLNVDLRHRLLAAADRALNGLRTSDAVTAELRLRAKDLSVRTEIISFFDLHDGITPDNVSVGDLIEIMELNWCNREDLYDAVENVLVAEPVYAGRSDVLEALRAAIYERGSDVASEDESQDG